MKRSIALIALMTTLLTVSISASPTLYGPTGLVLMPTAEALKYKEVNFSYDYIYAEEAKNDEWYYKANVGTFKNWELGVVGGSKPDEGMYLNTKYYLLSDESRYAVAAAIGLENIASKDSSRFYMVASKKFRGGLSGHLGFRANVDKEPDPSLMVGAQYFINNELTVMSDFLGENKKYILNLAAGYYIVDSLMLRVAVLDAMDAGTNGMRYSLGVAYSKYL